MEEDVTRMLLQGITLSEFKLLFLVGIIGIISRFLYNVVEGVKRDPNTPTNFKFRYFIKGLARLVLSLIILALVIARFQEFSHLLVNIDTSFTIPTRLPNGIDVVSSVGITAGGAFGAGLFIDDIVKRSVGKGDRVIKKIKNGK